MILYWRKLKPFLFLAILLSASVVSLIKNDPAFAYDIKDYSITTDAACVAAGGTLKTEYQGSTLVSYCQTSSSPDQESKLILSAAWLADCVNGSINYHSSDVFSNSTFPVKYYQIIWINHCSLRSSHAIVLVW